MDRKQPVPPARNSSFFKVLIGDFTEQPKMPPAYVERVECFIGASRCKLNCILRRQLANHDELWHGYAGNLQFVVEIYDTTCYEKEVPTRENNNCKSTVPVVKRNTGPVTRSKTSNVICTDHGRGENGPIEAAAKFLSKSNNPSFKILIGPSHSLCGSVYLPSDFLTHMTRPIQNVKIEASDNSWKVRLLRASSRGRLSGGWKQCARDNSLQPGDVCVFELIIKNDSVLKLSIFRNK